MLVLQIENHLHRHMGGTIANFEQVLSKPQSDLAQSFLKNLYYLGVRYGALKSSLFLGIQVVPFRKG